MALTRANATTYLVGQYGTGTESLLVLANIGLTDTAGGLKEIIDDAFLETGVAFSDLATDTIADSDVSNALALLRFTALRKILSNLNAAELRGDLKIGDIALSGLVANVKDMISLEISDLKTRGLVGVGVNAAAFLGGISHSAVTAREQDTDRVSSFFTRKTSDPRGWSERLGEWPS